MTQELYLFLIKIYISNLKNFTWQRRTNMNYAYKCGDFIWQRKANRNHTHKKSNQNP